MHNLVFLDKVSEIQQCMHAKSVCWNTLAPQNCIKLSQIYVPILVHQMQPACILSYGSTIFNNTGGKRACIHPHGNILSIHSIQCKRGSCSSSSYPVATALALCFTNAVATQNQSHIAKCSINFPHRGKMLQRWVLLEAHLHFTIAVLCAPRRHANQIHKYHSSVVQSPCWSVQITLNALSQEPQDIYFHWWIYHRCMKRRYCWWLHPIWPWPWR